MSTRQETTQDQGGMTAMSCLEAEACCNPDCNRNSPPSKIGTGTCNGTLLLVSGRVKRHPFHSFVWPEVSVTPGEKLPERGGARLFDLISVAGELDNYVQIQRRDDVTR